MRAKGNPSIGAEGEHFVGEQADATVTIKRQRAHLSTCATLAAMHLCSLRVGVPPQRSARPESTPLIRRHARPGAQGGKINKIAGFPPIFRCDFAGQTTARIH